MQKNNMIVIYMKDESTKKFLDSIFYDKGFLMKGLPLFI